MYVCNASLSSPPPAGIRRALQKLPYVFLEPLIEVETFISIVFLQHHGHIDQTVLIARQLVAELLAVPCQPLDFLLAPRRSIVHTGTRIFITTESMT